MIKPAIGLLKTASSLSTCSISNFVFDISDIYLLIIITKAMVYGLNLFPEKEKGCYSLVTTLFLLCLYFSLNRVVQVMHQLWALFHGISHNFSWLHHFRQHLVHGRGIF